MIYQRPQNTRFSCSEITRGQINNALNFSYGCFFDRSNELYLPKIFFFTDFSTTYFDCNPYVVKMYPNATLISVFNPVILMFWLYSFMLTPNTETEI